MGAKTIKAGKAGSAMSKVKRFMKTPDRVGDAAGDFLINKLGKPKRKKPRAKTVKAK